MKTKPETLITLITVQDALNASGLKTIKRSQIAAAVLLKERIRCVDLAKLMQVSKQNCMVTVKAMQKERLLRVESIKGPDGRKTAWVMPVRRLCCGLDQPSASCWEAKDQAPTKPPAILSPVTATTVRRVVRFIDFRFSSKDKFQKLFHFLLLQDGSAL